MSERNNAYIQSVRARLAKGRWALSAMEWDGPNHHGDCDEIIEHIDAVEEELKQLVESLTEMIGYVESEYTGPYGKDLTGGALTRAKAILKQMEEAE